MDSIKTRIKKLLALSKSPNQHEAEAAMDKAVQLMEEYGLKDCDVLFTEEEIRATKRPCKYRDSLMYAVSWLYSVYAVRNSYKGVFSIYGENLHVFLCKEMYAYLVKAVERIAKEAIHPNAKTAYRRSFKTGLAINLCERIFMMGKEVSWAPEREENRKRIEKSFSQKYNIMEADKRKSKINWKAFATGSFYSSKISLNKQATGSGGRFIE